MKLKIIEDFLEQEDYELIRNVMMSNDSFHWQFADGCNYRGDGHHMFCHVFYAQWEPRSKFFSILKPILEASNQFSCFLESLTFGHAGYPKEYLQPLYFWARIPLILF